MSPSAAASSPNAVRHPATLTLEPHRALAIPILFIAGLASLALCDPVRQNPRLLWSVLVTATALIGWSAVMFMGTRRVTRVFDLDVALRPLRRKAYNASSSVP